LSEAVTSNEIDLLDTQLTGPFTVNAGILLSGGWNAPYQGKSGLPTTLNGILTIQSGDSTAETIVVRGKLAIQGGALRVNDVKVQP
jgi:hypothetical protein